MTRLTYSQKTTRVLKFLEASVHPQINPMLAGVGYGERDVDEGWELLRHSGLVRLVQETPEPASPRAREQLDRFENYWFPIVSASLLRRYPELHAQVFQNLSRGSGVEVALNVSIFLERVDGIAAHPQGAEIFALLAARGFTEEVRAEARELLAQFKSAGPAPEPDLDQLKKDHEAAVADAWEWYLEWSTIARTVITNRQHLRMLGFLKRSGSAAVDGEDEEALEVEDEMDEESSELDLPNTSSAASSATDDLRSAS